MVIADEKTVARISALSKLTVGEDEKEKIVDDMNKIISYVAKLSELNIEFASYAEEKVDGNTLRDDTEKTTGTPAELFRSALKQTNGMPTVPNTLRRNDL